MILPRVTARNDRVEIAEKVVNILGFAIRKITLGFQNLAPSPVLNNLVFSSSVFLILGSGLGEWFLFFLCFRWVGFGDEGGRGRGGRLWFFLEKHLEESALHSPTAPPAHLPPPSRLHHFLQLTTRNPVPVAPICFLAAADELIQFVVVVLLEEVIHLFLRRESVPFHGNPLHGGGIVRHIGCSIATWSDQLAPILSFWAADRCCYCLVVSLGQVGQDELGF